MVVKELILSKIYEIRCTKIIFDFDLSELFDVETRTLKQAVRRNIFQKRIGNSLSQLVITCLTLLSTALHLHLPLPSYVNLYITQFM